MSNQKEGLTRLKTSITQDKTLVKEQFRDNTRSFVISFKCSFTDLNEKKIDAKVPANDLWIAQYLSNRLLLFEQIPQIKKKIPAFQRFKSVPKVHKDKSLPPNETVSRIITILKNLFEGSHFKIAHHLMINTPPSSWSAQVGIFHGFRKYFQSNGKALSIELTMASLYGELIERIQAGFFFSRNPFKPRIQSTYKKQDSREITEEVIKLNDEFESLSFPNSNPISNTSEEDLSLSKNLLYYPFIDLIKSKPMFIRSSLLISSNGLASGNSYEEAFIQAFCEIVERFTAYEILKNKLKLPTIPVTRCSPEIQHLIEEIEATGFHIKIKDASLNLGIPAVAVVFVLDSRKPEERRGILISFGAASSLDVAVERCITEALQGINNLGLKNFYNHLQVQSVDRLYQTFSHLERYVSKEDYFIRYRLKTNFFPSDELEFLLEDQGIPNYEEFFSHDLKDEVDYIIQTFSQQGFRFYMKDHNWLGFPTVRIFIPELNHFYPSQILRPNSATDRFKKKLLTEFSDITREDLHILETPEFILVLLDSQDLRSLFRIHTLTLEQYSVWLFFGLLAFAFNYDELSEKYFRQHDSQFDFKTFQAEHGTAEGRNAILNELSTILPNPNTLCKGCRFKEECKYTLKKEFEADLLKRFPDRFNIIH